VRNNTSFGVFFNMGFGAVIITA